MRTKIQARARVRTALAAGGILALAWCVMGAAPYGTSAPGLTNSAPEFTVNRLSKGDRLPMTPPAVQHGRSRLSRLLDSDFPSNWHWKG
jgi:hypothetical protein